MSIQRQRVIRAMQRLYPLHLADSSWDNVGLLVDAVGSWPRPGAGPEAKTAKRVLLTIDLTMPVLADALTRFSDIDTIITYHPVIFRGLKSITREQSDGKGEVLLRCMREGISVYSPHTSVDAAKGGNNDWLASAFKGHYDESKVEAVQCHPLGQKQTGYGRVFPLRSPLSLRSAIELAKGHLKMRHLRYARAHRSDSGASSDGSDDRKDISTVAVCCGSGASVFKGVKADLLLTGEMSHHEVLGAVSAGQHVILAEHTNTERGFLPVLQAQLEEELRKDGGDASQILFEISPVDEDPIKID